MKKGKLFAVLTTIFSLFLASCEVEIGLGEAVDTEPPSLTVYEATANPADPNYKPVPKAGDVVRGYFMLAGQATDDKEIKSLTISFANLSDTSGEAITFNTMPDKLTGEWAVIIDPAQEIANAEKAAKESDEEVVVPVLPDGMKAETKPIPDGEYQVTFTVVDDVKHQTIVTRQFRIDNTPPVIVIDRPSSRDDAEENAIDSYGQSFTLEGQSADDNDVSLIEVKVYNTDDPNALYTPNTITLTNVPSRINMDIATYVEGEEGADSDYAKIYGSNEKEGSKNFYFELTAYLPSDTP